MDIYNMLDWIQQFQSSTTDLSRCNPPMTDLEKQKCVDWVISNIINEEYLHRLDEIERGLVYWSIDKNVMQIEGLTFRILGDYLSWYLRFPTVDILHTYIDSQIEVLEEYIHQYDADIIFSKWDLSISINDILWSLIYMLWNICESFGIDINKIQLRTSCRLPLAEFIGLPLYTKNTTPTIKPQPQTTLPSKWQDYIIGPNKEAWEHLITEELNNAGGRSGRLFAMIILAMRREGAIKEIPSKTKCYALFRKTFTLLATDSSINKYLNTDSPNSCDPPILDDEIEVLIKKVGSY